MKHPTPSDFAVDVSEAHVSVAFRPSDSHYSFGRLADPDHRAVRPTFAITQCETWADRRYGRLSA
jgi:hypothetical protein